jgi:uncharacterized protein YkwD
MRKTSQQSQKTSFKLESMRFFPIALITVVLLFSGCGVDLSGLTGKNTETSTGSSSGSSGTGSSTGSGTGSSTGSGTGSSTGSGSGSSNTAPANPGTPATGTQRPVVPTPEAPKPTPTLSAEAQTALQLVNAARAQARNCGSVSYPAAPALTWNSKLEAAARAFNQDMISKQFFDHIGPDGSTPATRVTAQGYSWSTIGENIALGSLGSSLDTVSGAVQGWLASPGHCRNIMNTNFTEMGLVGTAGDWNGYDALYWTQEFGRPR